MIQGGLGHVPPDMFLVFSYSETASGAIWGKNFD